LIFQRFILCWGLLHKKAEQLCERSGREELTLFEKNLKEKS
jgi:hypothetical protein